MDAPPTPTQDSRESPQLRLSGADACPGSTDPEVLLEEARQLLVALKVDRSRVEARLAEFGREDPIEVVKGSSALDEAIERCQNAIERLDQLVGSNRAH